MAPSPASEPPVEPHQRTRRSGILGRPWVLTPVLALFVALGTALWVLAQDLDYVAPHGGMPERVELEPPDLRVGARTVTGVLRNPGGSPLAGALVATVDGGRPIWTYTDGEGRFTLRELRDGEHELQLLARGFRPVVSTVQVGPDTPNLELRTVEGNPVPPDVAEHPSSDLQGILVGWRPGSPVEDYEVLVLPLSSPTRVGIDVPRRARVDGGGRFRVPDLIHGRYRLAVLPPSARGGSWPDLLRGWSDPPMVHQHAGNEDLLLTVAAGRLAGVARDDDGQPLPGALVRVRPLEPTSPGLPMPSVRCAEDGSWTVPDLPPGRYEVQLSGGPVRRRVEVVVEARQVLEPEL